jgi:hypothetical protein
MVAGTDVTIPDVGQRTHGDHGLQPQHDRRNWDRRRAYRYACEELTLFAVGRSQRSGDADRSFTVDCPQRLERRFRWEG